MIASLIVGCGWMVLMISCPVVPVSVQQLPQQSFRSHSCRSYGHPAIPNIWHRRLLYETLFYAGSAGLPETEKELAYFQRITSCFGSFFRKAYWCHLRAAVGAGWNVVVINGFNMHSGNFSTHNMPSALATCASAGPGTTSLSHKYRQHWFW